MRRWGFAPFCAACPARHAVAASLARTLGVTGSAAALFPFHMTPRNFRILLTLSVVLSWVGAAVDYLFPLLSEPFKQAQMESDQLLSGAVISGALLVAFGLLVATVVAYVGLYMFRPWAPRLSVVVTVSALFVLPLLGSTAQSGLATTLNDAADILWGVVLALAYWSPLATRFVNSDA